MAVLDKTKEVSGNIVRDIPAGNVSSINFQVDTSEINMTATDEYKIVELAPYSIIHNFQCVVNTAEGATALLNIGLYGDDITNDADGLDADVNLNAAAGSKTFSIAGTDASIGLNVGASGAFITVSPEHALDTAIFTITALISQSQN